MATKLSPYAHLVDIDEGVLAAWNSLWLRPIFLTGKEAEQVQGLFHGETDLDLGLEKLLAENNFFAESSRDEKKLKEVEATLLDHSIGILYLIMTEGCNLACTHCFLRDMVVREGAMKKKMSLQVAKTSIDKFAETVASSDTAEPQIIFYGGEPLLNWKVLSKALAYAAEKMPKCTFTINTNGTLITPEVAQILKRHNVLVALSIDGKEHDAYRVTESGRGSLQDAIRALKVLQEHQVSVGISYTITEANVALLVSDFEWLVGELRVESIDYNILIGNDVDIEGYAPVAVRALLEVYQVARERGIFIDRVMRRVDPIVSGSLNLFDCGGCGQQMVFSPDGNVGCCHAFLNEGEFFFPLEEVLEPDRHEHWTMLKGRSPLAMPVCNECPALGTCGGGCFYSAHARTGDVMNLDLVHCELAKQTLQLSLRELWQETQKN